MRAIRSFPALALLAPATVCALTIGMPPAQAEVKTEAKSAVMGDNNITSYGFSVTPSTIAAGGQVTLKVDGCSDTATASSGVFDTVRISPGQSATATVDWDAKPGAMYTVTFSCKGETGTTNLTIASGSGGWTHQPTNPPIHHGVKAGIGGSLADLDFGEIAFGAVLIAGALGSALHFARRRPADGEHS
ncbi:hypothetical protein H9Y04_14700 [Streptomyces sp. TRM66268-LWL]|uniref:Lipoprotein n=1 Tax=Streptomyces polyasparticus TaxID=2767826 RepID=A0ABR7SHN0_9ACTN|nr:hypothetical protein [Streptomyces polyasparticus]MBC9713818.1 hypothetical protein [Streptomyces polyasparticus]